MDLIQRGAVGDRRNFLAGAGVVTPQTIGGLVSLIDAGIR